MMRQRRLSISDTLKYALPVAGVLKTHSMLKDAGFKWNTDTASFPLPEDALPPAGGRITIPFIPAPITTTWDWSDLDYTNSNDAPNLNLTVMALVLATNAETTLGGHAWTNVENTLRRLGFTNTAHHYFEDAEQISRAAMVFGRSIEPVNGKYVVAAVYRGSSSIEDAISDAKSELDGFYEAGMAGASMLRAYVTSEGLTKENTTLFITGHSYGASNASLVGILSTDIAERDSIFCYPFATPNYNRHGLTGDGMKMFSFDSNEDVVPQVPVGPNLDKTGVDIRYDRFDIQLNNPARYERFLRLYKYFRGKDFEEDSDFMPDAYSGNRGAVKVPVNSKIVRNHMPYTYMALILSEYSDEVIDGYIGKNEGSEEEAELVLEMSAGEVYKLPGLYNGDENGVTVTWESSDESVIGISDGRFFAAKKAGSATLTATASDGSRTIFEVNVVD